MARDINEIQQSVLDAKEATASLSALETLTAAEVTASSATSNSTVSVWRQWVWVFSKALQVFERVMDTFRDDVEQRIAATRPHTKNWYRQKAFDFQYGYSLVPETDYYDNTGLTDQQIADSKVVNQAAAVRTIISGAGALRLKVARTLLGVTAPLTEPQRVALQAYFDQVTDAGTVVLVTTGPADDLKLVVDVYYDPLILDASGARLDGTSSEPVQEGVVHFLSSIVFNGQFVVSRLDNYLESLKGVKVVKVREARSKYADYSYTSTAPNVGLIDEIRVADAGYMKLDQAASTFNFIPFFE